MLTDPVADMLTRIRNAVTARKARVDVPWSRHKADIARALVEEGFLGAVEKVDGVPRATLRIELRYDNSRRPVIEGIERVSRPSLRVYVGKGKVPPVRGGLGVSVLSTPRGVMVDRDARRQGVGGEVLCRVW
jgi:small subunit ribosomal protein S8